MTKQKEDYIVKGSIVLFFVLYMIGYAWLIEPKQETVKKTEKETMIHNRKDGGQRNGKQNLCLLAGHWI